MMPELPENPELIKCGFCTLLRKLIFIVFLRFLFFLSTPSNTQFINPNSKAIETAGDVLFYALPASAALTTLVLDDKKGSWQFTKSFIANSAVTLGLKYVLNKPRPFDGGGQAFPSGHTSVTFQAASFVHRRYGFKYSVPAYLLAGFTGYSRINATRHDGYDILAGAVVGIGSSFLFTTPYEQEHMQLTFTSSDDHYMLGFVYKF